MHDRNRLIARLDVLARNEDLQEKLAISTEWDLVICDEAHRMSATFFGGEVKYTRRYQLGQRLGQICRHLLLMSATSHNGKEEDFQLFMALLDGDRFERRFRDGVHYVDTADMMRRLTKEELLRFDGPPLSPERCAYTVTAAGESPIARRSDWPRIGPGGHPARCIRPGGTQSDYVNSKRQLRASHPAPRSRWGDEHRSGSSRAEGEAIQSPRAGSGLLRRSAPRSDGEGRRPSDNPDEPAPGKDAGRFIGEYTLTPGAVKNKYIRLTTMMGMFPADVIGGSNERDAAPKEILIDWGGPAFIRTDLDGSHKFFRRRDWIGLFFERTGARPGDHVRVEETGPYRYRVTLVR